MSGGDWKEMFEAAVAGDLELVRFHVRAGVDVNYAHPEYLSTPLVATILAGQERVAKFLLSSGADPNLRSEFDGMTPIQAVRSVKLPEVEAMLLEHVAYIPVAPPVKQSWLSRLFSRVSDQADR